jgi:hypothetical protein
MPIQIRELIITTTVEEGKGGAQMSGESSGSSGKSNSSQEQLIQECVDQVLRILKQQGRR